jgi:hypothetical protein
VFDGVHAEGDRQLGAGQPLRVRSHPVAEPVRLVDQRRDLGPGQLRGVRVLQLHRAGAGGHDLDEVRAEADLLADRLAHLVRPVGLAVHPVEEPGARGAGRHDPPTGQQPRPAERPVPHGLARGHDVIAVGTDVTHGGDPHPQGLPQPGGEEVLSDPRPDRLGAGGRHRRLGEDVGMGVDQPRHQHPASEVDHPRTVRNGIPGTADPGDEAVLDQDSDPGTDRRRGPVEQTGAGQPQPAGARWRGGQQRCKPTRHPHHPCRGPRGRVRSPGQLDRPGDGSGEQRRFPHRTDERH